MTPQKEWTLHQLAAFCRQTLRRTAQDAHDIGTALLYAREKHKKTRDWLAWLKASVGITQSVAYRYIAVARKTDRKEIETKSINEVYQMIGEKKPSIDGLPSWAVAEKPSKLAGIVSALATYIATLPESEKKRRLESIHTRLVAELERPVKAAG